MKKWFSITPAMTVLMVGMAFVSHALADGQTDYNSAPSGGQVVLPGTNGDVVASQNKTVTLKGVLKGNLSINAGTIIADGLTISAATAETGPCYTYNKTSYDAYWWNGMDCGACHPLSSLSGAHNAHIDTNDANTTWAGYGDKNVTECYTTNSTINKLGCGNCHPMDGDMHMNGVNDIVLAPEAGTPSQVIKARNTTASYNATSKTCSNVYCHSSNGWTTTGTRLNLVVTTTRQYRQVSWTAASGSLGCFGCHGDSGSGNISPMTTAPNNLDGAGDSHNYIDGNGDNNLHIWNMSYDPISCRTCHNDTVKDATPFVENPVTHVRTWRNVALYNKAKHVNGTADVAFDTVNQPSYAYTVGAGGTRTYDLSVARYEGATKTCSNVGCHKSETTVTWGTPYSYAVQADCNRCHQK